MSDVTGDAIIPPLYVKRPRLTKNWEPKRSCQQIGRSGFSDMPLRINRKTRKLNENPRRATTQCM